MSRVLVTGGAGFIGSHLVDELIRLGHKVVILDDLSTGSETNLNPQAEFYHGSLLEKDLLEFIFDEHAPEFVFHLAAQINLRHSLQNPVDDAEINIVGSLHLIECCLNYGVTKFIFSSTGGAIYDALEPLPWSEESNTAPSSPYGLSKKTIEDYLKLYGYLNKLSWVSLRYANVYGPRQNDKSEAGVISIFINQALRGETLKIFGSGFQTRDYIYVSDVVSANVLAMSPRVNGIFNVGTNQEHTLQEIIIRLKQYISPIKTAHVAAIPGELLRSALGYCQLSYHGWSPQVTLKQGLYLTFNYFRNEILNENLIPEEVSWFNTDI